MCKIKTEPQRTPTFKDWVAGKVSKGDRKEMTREARRKPGEVDSKKPREKCFQGGGQFVICGYKIKPQEK